MKSLLAALLWLWAGAALAQSSPGWTTGFVPTAAQWNAQWASKANTVSPAITGTLTWNSTAASGFGAAIGQVPIVTSYRSSGRPGIILQPGGLIFGKGAPTVSDSSDVLIQRNIAVVGGSSSQINSALRVDTGPGVADNTAAWAFLSSMKTAQATGADALASYIQAWRLPGSNAHVWGEVVEVTDQTGLDSLTSGNPVLSMEMDLSASGADNATNPSKFANIGSRSFVHFAGSNFLNTGIYEITTGLWFGMDALSVIDSVIGFSDSMHIRNALDTRGALPPASTTNPLLAVTMSPGHAIDFNGPTTITAAPRNYLVYDSGTARLKYIVNGVTRFSIDDAGNVRANGTIAASTTP